MATNLFRDIYRSARRIGLNSYAAYTAKKIDTDAQKHRTAALRRQHASRRVSGVKRATLSTTSGTRTNRARQLKAMRANPTTRAALKRRVHFYTPSASP